MASTTDKARAAVLDALRRAANCSPEALAEVRSLLRLSDIGGAMVSGDVGRAASSLAAVITGGHVSRERKILDYTLYDQDFLTDSGVQNRNFFTSLNYQAGPLVGTQKGVGTNMTSEGVVVTPKRHEATGILLEVLPDPATGLLPSLADLLSLRANVWLVLFQGTRPVRRIKWGLTSGPGVQVIANAASTLQAAQSGAASAHDYLRFGELRFINESDEPFRVQLASSPDFATTDPLLIRVSLAGVEETTTG